ncbi:MAG: adenine phosphoribosyltransferase [bacterium]|nr:adenine phosphoribosyltransferase [bacterium]
MDLKKIIAEIPDFPKPGILFRDIEPILADPEAMGVAIEWLKAVAKEVGAEKIAGFDARGFVFGAALAHELKLPFIMLRKKGKLAGKTISIAYKLEYGEAVLEMSARWVHPGDRILLVDDLLATGGTSGAGVVLIERAGGKVAGLAYVIEIAGLAGRKALEGYPIHTLVTYDNPNE